MQYDIFVEQSYILPFEWYISLKQCCIVLISLGISVPRGLLRFVPTRKQLLQLHHCSPEMTSVHLELSSLIMTCAIKKT